MTGEERILAIEGDGADQVFNPVGVDLDAAVGQEGLQPIPVVMDVGHLFSQPGFLGDLAALRLKPVAEGGHRRCGAGLTGGQARTASEQWPSGGGGGLAWVAFSVFQDS